MNDIIAADPRRQPTSPPPPRCLGYGAPSPADIPTAAAVPWVWGPLRQPTSPPPPRCVRCAVCCGAVGYSAVARLKGSGALVPTMSMLPSPSQSSSRKQSYSTYQTCFVQHLSNIFRTAPIKHVSYSTYQTCFADRKLQTPVGSYEPKRYGDFQSATAAIAAARCGSKQISQNTTNIIV